MQTRKTRHAVYNINYHLVFCPKYRRPVLVGETKTFIEQTFQKVCEDRGWILFESVVQPDHVHIFIGVQPVFAPSFVVKVLKGATGIHLAKANRFWSPSYYVGTAGTVTRQTIEKYIQQQKEGGSDSPPGQ